MKKLFLLLLLLLLASSARAQLSPASSSIGSITTNAANCNTTNACVTLHMATSNIGYSATIAGTWTGTLTVEQSGDNQGSWTSATTTTSNTLYTSALTPGITDVRVRGSAAMTGTAVVTITASGPAVLQQITQTGAGGGGGGIAPGPADFPSGLLAWYRCMPTDTIASLKDYAGTNNATGTVGTAPTLIAGSGGCNFTGNGAIILPTTLNAALTIQILVSYQQSSNANTFNAPICSNGGGGIVNVSCLLINSGASVFTVTSPQAPAIGPIPFNDSGGKTVVPRTIINGTAVLSWSMGAADHVYINNDEICNDQVTTVVVCPGGTGTSAGRNLFPYQLGGSAAGSGLAAASYYTGQIYGAAIYSTAKTAAEIAQGRAVLVADAANRGITVALGQNSGNTGNCQMFHDGDSQTAGGGSLATYYPTIVLENTGCTWDIINGGGVGTSLLWSSSSASGARYQADTEVRPFQPGLSLQTPFNVITAWLGTNDCKYGTPSLTAANMYQRWANYIRQRKRAGWDKVVVGSMISRTENSCNGASCDPCKNLINPVIRQNWRAFGADGFVDLGATQLGADAACTSGGASGRLCSDSVHPTQDAEYNIVALSFQRAINGLFGNFDFTTATNYAAAAPAAVAITAASEATNTMTFTSASGAPAVGQCAFVSGVTPAGYNTPADSCWNVLTSNGTTSWTAYNGTTGLGAGSVFGTFSVPLQKDQDNYAVLNFGAGNYTLQPCWMWMGVNTGLTTSGIPAIGIKNINAGSSTIVPWSTETIEGAANFTLTTGSTAYFAPILVSSSAAGCNWRKVN